MKKTRFISGIIAAAMMLGAVSSNGLAYKLSEQPPVPLEDVDVYRTYMDSNWGITGGTFGDFGKNNSKALKIGGTTGLQQVKHIFREGQDQGFKIDDETGKAPLETAFKHGLGMISFDIQPNQTSSGILILGINDNKGNSVPTVVFTPAGKMYFNDRHGWNIEEGYVPQNARDYTADEWYTIKILIDANNGRFVYYVNGEYWGQYVQERTTPFNARVNPDLDMQEMLFNYHPTWQNESDYSQAETAGGTFILDNLAFSVPKLDTYDLICETGKAGNIYSGKSAELTYYLINEGTTSKEFVLTTDFRTLDNRSAGKRTVTKTVPADSEVSVKMSPDFVEYGFYTAYSTVIDNSGTVILEDTTRFSMSATAENEKTGFGVHPMTHGVGTLEETIEINKSLGGTLLREELPWSLVSDVATGNITTTDWSKWKKFPEMIKENGGEMLLLLTPGDNSIAGVDWPLSNATTTADKDALDKWALYAKAVATNLGDSIDYYEVYNEWRGQAKAAWYEIGGSTAAYAELLKKTSTAIKEADSDAKIAAFCVFYDDKDVEWLDKVLSKLGDNPGQYFDIVTVHPYMTYYSKENYPDAAFIEGMEKIKQVLSRYDVSDKPLYATEYGFSTGYALPVDSNLDLGNTDNDEAERTYPIDENMKADFTARNLIMSNKYFEKSFMYSMNEKVNDRNTTSEGRLLSDYEKGLGFTRNTYNTEIPYEAMPTALAFSGYNSILSGATYEAEYIYDKDTTDEADDTYAYKFTLADGNDCIAMWNVSGTENLVSVNVGAESATIYDMYGNEKTLNAIDGKLTFMLGTAPVYIKASTLNKPVFENVALFTIPETVTTGTNKNYEIAVTTTESGSYTISAECGSNARVVKNGATNGAALKLRSLDNQKANAAYDFSSTKLNEKTASEDNVLETVTVKVVSGGKTYLSEKVEIMYDGSVGEAITYSFEIDSLGNDSWWNIMNKRVDQNSVIKEKDCENGIIFKVNSDI